MGQIEIMNPVATSATGQITPAKRLDKLSDQTIGLYWNIKSGGDIALNRMAELLKRRYPGLRFKMVIGAVGSGMRHATTEQLDAMGAECQAVIGTSAD